MDGHTQRGLDEQRALCERERARWLDELLHLEEREAHGRTDLSVADGKDGRVEQLARKLPRHTTERLRPNRVGDGVEGGVGRRGIVRRLLVRHVDAIPDLPQLAPHAQGPAPALTRLVVFVRKVGDLRKRSRSLSLEMDVVGSSPPAKGAAEMREGHAGAAEGAPGGSNVVGCERGAGCGRAARGGRRTWVKLMSRKKTPPA